MRSAVIVSTARTPIGKAVRGAFNMTKAPTLGALSVREAVARAGIDLGEVDDVVYGSALQQGAAANNVRRPVCGPACPLRLRDNRWTANVRQASWRSPRRPSRSSSIAWMW